MSKPMFGSKSSPYGSLANLVIVPPRDLSNLIAIVTGANTGIGLETARSLYQQGCHVILACRSKAKAEAAIVDLSTSLPLKTADGVELKLGKLEFRELDLSKLSSAREFAASWQADEMGKIDLMINNAGALIQGRFITEDGFEKTYQTNCLTSELLTLLLLPYIKISPSPRILLVSSSAAYTGELDPNNLNAENLAAAGNWRWWNKISNSMKIYSNSKLYQVCFTRSLQQQLLSDKSTSHIITAALHPGVVASSIINASELPKLLQAFYNSIFTYLGRNTIDGAKTTLYVALSPELEIPEKQLGQFYADCGIAEMRKGAEDDRMNKELWERSLKDCGMEDWKL